jgi:hypothetical protein
MPQPRDNLFGAHSPPMSRLEPMQLDVNEIQQPPTACRADLRCECGNSLSQLGGAVRAETKANKMVVAQIARGSCTREIKLLENKRKGHRSGLIRC